MFRLGTARPDSRHAIPLGWLNKNPRDDTVGSIAAGRRIRDCDDRPRAGVQRLRGELKKSVTRVQSFAAEGAMSGTVLASVNGHFHIKFRFCLRPSFPLSCREIEYTPGCAVGGARITAVIHIRINVKRIRLGC